MSLPAITLRQVLHFVTLVRQKNYARAAAELQLTQSALTRSIQALEQRYAVKLFDRGRAGVRLTPAGKQVLADAEALLHQADAFAQGLAAQEDGTRGKVAFGVGPSEPTLLPDLIPDLVKDYPELVLRVEVHSANVLIELLIGGQIEVAVCGDRLIPDDAPVDTMPLKKIHVAILVRPGHPLAKRRRVTMDMLRKYPLVHGNLVDVNRATVWSPTVACDDYMTLFAITRKTDAVWPTAGFGHELVRGKLVELSVVDNRFIDTMRLVILTAKRRTLSAQARLVIDRLVQTAGE